MNTSLQDILKNELVQLVQESQVANGIGHEGLKGTAREEILSKFLRKYLPHQWGLGKGKIVDSLGNESSECDLVIYDRSSLPVGIIGTTVNVFPVESVKYVIEVKSTLRIADVKSTIQKFNNIKSLSNRSDFEIRRVLFAYASDLKSKPELDRFKENDPEFHLDPAIRILLVIGKGYWSFSRTFYQFKESKNGLRISKYLRMNPSDKYFEIARFLFAVLDTLNPNLPSFKQYFSPEDSDAKFYVEHQHLIEKVEFIKELEKKKPIQIELLISINQVLNNEDEKFRNKINRFYYKILGCFRPRYKAFSYKSMEETHTYPVVEIEIKNLDSNETLEISEIHLLTSENLMFFRGIEDRNTWLHHGAEIRPKEMKTLVSKFIGFPKRENEKSGGKLDYKQNDKYGNHSVQFSGAEMGTLIKARLYDLYGNVYYSNSIEVKSTLENEENSHLDFLLYDLGSVKKYDGKNSYGMQMISKGKLYDKR